MGTTIVKYVLPGIILIGLGFYAGAQPNVVIGLGAFLAFFVAGVTLIAEGIRRNGHKKD